MLLLCLLTTTVCVLLPEALPGCKGKTICELELPSNGRAQHVESAAFGAAVRAKSGL